MYLIYKLIIFSFIFLFSYQFILNVTFKFSLFPFLSYLLRCNGGSCIKMVIRSIFWCNHFICQWYVLLYFIQLLCNWRARFVHFFHFLLKFWASFSTFLRCLCKFFILVFDENMFIWSFRKYPQYYELEVVVMLYMKIYFPRFC